MAVAAIEIGDGAGGFVGAGHGGEGETACATGFTVDGHMDALDGAVWPEECFQLFGVGVEGDVADEDVQRIERGWKGEC